MEILIGFAFILLTSGSLLVNFIPSFQCVAKHGKLADANLINTQEKGIFDFLAKFTVPKSLFTYMYVWSIILSVSLLVFLDTDKSIDFDLLLFLGHSGRRLYECIFITEYGKSRMNIGGLAAGMAHYSLVPLCLANSSSLYPIMNPFPLILFCMASSCQFYCHLILFWLKQNYAEENNSSKYKLGKDLKYSLPKGFLFDYICCPHYSMEILIYLSFFIQNPQSISRLCMVCWVTSNLSVVANVQYLWYFQHTPDEILSHRIYRLVPFVW